MTNLIRSLIRDERGATAIEYGLIATLIGVAVLAAVTGVGSSLQGRFNNVANAVQR